MADFIVYSRDGSAIMLAWQLHQTLVMGRYAHLRFGVESGYEPKPGTLFSADWHVYWELTRGTLKRAGRLVRSHAYGDDAKVPADERTKYQLAFAEDAARQYLSEALPRATATEIMQLACLCPDFFDQSPTPYWLGVCSAWGGCARLDLRKRWW